MTRLWNRDGSDILVPDDKVPRLIDAGWMMEPPVADEPAAEEDGNGDDARL